MTAPNPFDNLHAEFRSAIEAGDERLRDHIDQSIIEVAAAVAHVDKQVATALESAEKLEVERVTTIERRLADTEKHLDDADMRLREHIGLQVAQIERAVQGAREEVRLALAASDELERTRVEAIEEYAQTQRDAINQRVDRADDALREHIAAQVGQIATALEATRAESALALVSAERLEITRISDLASSTEKLVEGVVREVHLVQASAQEATRQAIADHVSIRSEMKEYNEDQEKRLAGVQREITIAFDASEKAIGKAEVANEKRFSSVNEFRTELSDRWAQTMPREVAEALNTAVHDRIRSLEVSIRALELSQSQRQGGDVVTERRDDRQQVSAGQMIAMVSVAVAVLGILAAIMVGSFT